MLNPALGVQAGWCLLPAPDTLLCGRAGLRRVSALHSPGTLSVLPQAISMVSVAGEFKWKHVIETASKAFWKSVDNFSLLNIAKGWGGMERGSADHKMCFLALMVLVLISIKTFLLTRVQLAQTPSRLSDRSALPLISDASI